jgi:hypothetical protein
MLRQRPRVFRQKPLRSNPPDPYAPTSPHFAERHRETITALPGGMVRVDVGKPIT